jgi:hypothetical protein
MTDIASQTTSATDEARPPCCFVSHAWAGGGHSFALALCAELGRRRVVPWVDEEQVLPGSLVEHSCRDGVLRKCEVFVALVGAAWIASQSCQDELQCALERRESDGLPIIPVHWERDVQLVPALAGICYIRLTDPSDSAGVDRLARAIRRGALVSRFVHALRASPLGQRHEAAQMLSRMAEPSTLPCLCHSLTKDDDPLTRYWSAIAVGSIGTPLGCAALRNAAKTETHLFVREGIQVALERGCRDENT